VLLISAKRFSRGASFARSSFTPEWVIDEKIGKNPSLVQIWDIKEVSEKLFASPRQLHRRTIAQTESHVLDTVAEELAADSQE
jgi:hypothetical protein